MQEEIFICERRNGILGLLVGRDGIRVDPKHAKRVRRWPMPTCVTELESFVGLSQFFRKFILNFLKIASSLTNLTKKCITTQKCSPQCNISLNKLKKPLCKAPVLITPDFRKPYRYEADASQKAAGRTFTQPDQDNRKQVVAYYSRKLSDTGTKYTASETKVLGLLHCLQRFRCYLEESTLDLFTSNQVLNCFLSNKRMSGKEARWFDLFAQFGIPK